MDDFLGYILEHHMLSVLLDFKKMPGDKQTQLDILSEIYHRCSPRLIPALVAQVFEICDENSDLMYRATKSLLKLPKMAVYSPSLEQMSQKHQAHRRREMAQYYLSKADKIASDQT
jgi:hypothetical protein